MDWVINVELQFPGEEPEPTPEQVRAHAKNLLELCIRKKYLSDYHLLSEPRQVDA